MPLNKRALLTSVLALPLAGAACGRSASDVRPLPQFAYRTPATRAAYEFAVGGGANLFTQLPCYCACVALGHAHLRDCFISDAGIFDSHAAGCEVCVDEALDAQRLLARGMPAGDIRAFIDSTYGRLGPGTKTPPV